MANKNLSKAVQYLEARLANGLAEKDPVDKYSFLRTTQADIKEAQVKNINAAERLKRVLNRVLYLNPVILASSAIISLAVGVVVSLVLPLVVAAAVGGVSVFGAVVGINTFTQALERKLDQNLADRQALAKMVETVGSAVLASQNNLLAIINPRADAPNSNLSRDFDASAAKPSLDNGPAPSDLGPSGPKFSQ